ncbi:MAG: phage tail fiber protein [Thiobacillus sp.]
MATLTAANSIFMLGASPLYPVAQQIQGFAADDAFASAEAQMGEAIMGVDGHLSGGYTPYKVEFDFTLQADSASNPIMDAIMDYQDSQLEVITFFATIQIPSLSMVYNFTRGFLTKGSPMPTAKKLMQPRKFTIEFNRPLRVPI